MCELPATAGHSRAGRAIAPDRRAPTAANAGCGGPVGPRPHLRHASGEGVLVKKDILNGLTVGDLFSYGRNFFVPEYQRDFAWKGENGAVLFEDIHGSMQPVAGVRRATAGADAGSSLPWSHYFLGTVVLMLGQDCSETSAGTPVEIVDGQQRFVALMVLFACLRDLEPDERRKQDWQALIGSPGNYRLTVKHETQPFFEQYVLAPGATAQLVPRHTGRLSLDNLGEMRSVLHRLLAGLKKGERAAFGDYLLERCHFGVVASCDRDRAYAIFSRINMRGVSLLPSDILKAEILGAIPAAQRPAYTERWNELRERLDDAFDGTARKKYLFSHINDIYGGNSSLINNIVKLVAQQGGARFMDDIVLPLGTAFAYLVNADYDHGSPAENEEINRLLRLLRWWSWQEWEVPTMLWLQRHARRPDRILSYLRALDRYLIARIPNYGTTKLWAKKDREKLFSEHLTPDILADADAVVPEKVFEVSSNLKEAARKRLSQDLDGRTGKIILLRLCMLRENMSIEQFEKLMGNAYNIEHVLPSNPLAQHDWQGFGDIEGSARKLGNLLIVKKRLNGLLGNSNWGGDDGKQALFRRYPDDIIGPDRDLLLGLEHWDAKALDERHERLMEAALDFWDLRVGWDRQLSAPVASRAKKLATAETETGAQPAKKPRSRATAAKGKAAVAETAGAAPAKRKPRRRGGRGRRKKVDPTPPQAAPAAS